MPGHVVNNAIRSIEAKTDLRFRGTMVLWGLVEQVSCISSKDGLDGCRDGAGVGPLEVITACHGCRDDVGNAEANTNSNVRKSIYIAKLIRGVLHHRRNRGLRLTSWCDLHQLVL